MALEPGPARSVPARAYLKRSFVTDAFLIWRVSIRRITPWSPIDDPPYPTSARIGLLRFFTMSGYVTAGSIALQH